MAKPFAPLSQSYQQCHNDALSSLLISLGVSLGNMDLFYPIATLLLLLLISISHWYRHNRWKNANWNENPHDNNDRKDFCEHVLFSHYTDHDKEQAIEALAILLLLERDKLFRRELEKEGDRLEKIPAIDIEKPDDCELIKEGCELRTVQPSTENKLTVSNHIITSTSINALAQSKIFPDLVREVVDAFSRDCSRNANFLLSLSSSNSAVVPDPVDNGD
jgi:hypothetical protein